MTSMEHTPEALPTTTGSWVVGHNLSGYLPEADTYAYADRADAVDAFRSMAEQYADLDDEMNDEGAEEDWTDEDYGSMRATVDSILKDDGPNTPDVVGKDYGMHVTDGRDRTIYFWLQWEATRAPDTDDLGEPLD